MSEPSVVPLLRARADEPSAEAESAHPTVTDPVVDGRVSALVDALGTGVVLHDAVGRIISVDRSAAEALGVLESTVLGRTWHDASWGVVREDGRPMAGHEHPVMQTLADGETRRGWVVGVTVRDQVRWLRFDVALLGPVAAVGALVTDVTSDVRGRLDVALETLRSRRLLSPERDVVLRVSRTGRVEAATESAEDVLGRPVDEVVGCSVVEFVSPADRPAVKSRFENLVTGEHAVMRVRVRRRGGERRWTRLGMRWVDADHTEAHVLLADEHDAVVASTAADELGGRLATVSLVAHETIALHGADGTFTWVSDRSAQDLGWEPEDLLGRTLHDLVHPDDAAHVDGAHSGGAGGDTVSVRYRFRGADDEYRLVETVLSGVLDPTTGRLLELRSASRPAEALLAAERRLDMAEELFRRCVEQSPVGVVVLGADGSWRRVNDALVQLLGRPRGALLRLDHGSLLVGPSRAEVLAGLRAVADGERDSWSGRAEYEAPDGSVLAVSLRAGALRDADHGLVSLLLHVQSAGSGGSVGAGGSLTAPDELTGLSQPELAVDRLVNALERSTRTGRSVGVLWVALDGLDDLVAAHGQAAGDSVLVEVASRLRRSLRLGDTLARVGHDAFVAVCEDVHELEVARVAARATACVDIATPGTDRGRVSASVGAAARPCSGTEDPEQVAEDLVASADAAARQVRLRGGAGWHHTKHSFV